MTAPAAVVVGNVQYDSDWEQRQKLLNLLASACADLNGDASGATALDHAWFIPFT